MKGCSGFGRRKTVAAHPELGAASIFERLVPNGRNDAGTINYSSYNGQAATVDVLIAKAANACRPDRDLGSTAQMMASLFNRTRQVDMLLAAGANRSIQDAAGRSASSVAADQGNAPMAARVKH
jgi:ankyrin repeat protein